MNSPFSIVSLQNLFLSVSKQSRENKAPATCKIRTSATVFMNRVRRRQLSGKIRTQPAIARKHLLQPVQLRSSQWVWVVAAVGSPMMLLDPSKLRFGPFGSTFFLCQCQ
jgi:hypothetical protein